MLSPDAKAIWKSPAGGNLVRAMLGLKPWEEEDRQTARELAKLSIPEDDDGEGGEDDD
jgi:hypothetical protein